MTDAPAPRRLAELYRAAMAQSPAAEPQALLSALDGIGSRESRDEVLSLAAANPAQAAILRTMASLRADSESLRGELRGLRRRPASQRPLWAALAASFALAAVVAVGLRPGVPSGEAPQGMAQDSAPESDRISAVSFESVADSAAEATLFRGSFDS